MKKEWANSKNLIGLTFKASVMKVVMMMGENKKKQIIDHQKPGLKLLKTNARR